MKTDKIYCFTCKKISFDNPTCSLQDSRINPRWNYRCPFCHGFKTLNASQFLATGPNSKYIRLTSGSDKKALRKYGNKLKRDGIISSYEIYNISKKRFILYERRRVKKELLKIVKKLPEKRYF